MKLDQVDRRILREIQKNARISNIELAERVNLSATPCARRVKQLEDAGIICGHVTLLDHEKLGLNLVAMISVTMDRHTADRFEKFELDHVYNLNLMLFLPCFYVKVIFPEIQENARIFFCPHPFWGILEVEPRRLKAMGHFPWNIDGN